MDTSLASLFANGGWVMWPLLVFSVVTWAVILERAFVFATLKPRINRLGQALNQSLKSGDAAAARQICHTEKPHVAGVFWEALDTNKKRDYAERLSDRSRIKMGLYLKKNLWVLGTIASASPFVGLLGTVVGIVRAFHNMSEKGAGGFSVVAGGISEALIATAAGLIVAIVALLTFNIFTTLANNTVGGIKITVEELLDLAYEKQNISV